MSSELRRNNSITLHRYRRMPCGTIRTSVILLGRLYGDFSVLQMIISVLWRVIGCVVVGTPCNMKFTTVKSLRKTYLSLL